jgi:uncharacterized membrane protein SpoIIM required for sporulation
VIIDLAKFLAEEQPRWRELEALLDRVETDLSARMSVAEIRRLQYLYQRASSGLARLGGSASDPALRARLEVLVARAYACIHETRREPARFNPFRWFARTFPQTFRRRIGAFWIALLVTAAGSAFGGLAIAYDPGSKAILMPFSHLAGDPSDRVAEEESAEEDHMKGARSQFSAMLIANNTRVSVLALALGVAYGLGTAILLFYNGVIIGAVSVDYILAGESLFLAGWLLPHGSVEIPAILVAGQAGILLGGALLGRGRGDTFRDRLRAVRPDLVTLIFGVALLLVWAGIVESFFSQYHEPWLPYWLKTTFGATQLVALFLFLGLAGRREETP